MVYPTLIKEVSSPFGMRNGKFHDGADFPVAMNSQLFSIADNGRLVLKQYDASGYGSYIVIDYGWFQALYAHLDRYPDHNLGYVFTEGELIGAISGNSGKSTGPHTHFEIRIGAWTDFWLIDPDESTKFLNSVDPIEFLESHVDAWTIINMLDSPSDWEKSIKALISNAEQYDLGIHNIWTWGEDLITKIYQMGRDSMKS